MKSASGILPFLAVAMISPSLAQAQAKGPLTIDAAVTEALSNSPEIQSARAAKSENEWKKFETLGSGFLPKIALDAHHYFGEQYSLTTINFGGPSTTFPGFYPENMANISATLPLFDGLANTRRYAAASLMDQAAAAELSHAEFQLRENIRLAFFKALAASQLQDVAEQNVKTLQDHLKQIETQRHGGVATGYDVLRIQVQITEANADAIDARDAVATSRLKLTQLLGLEHDDRTLDGSLPTPTPDKVKSLVLNESQPQRDDIRALEFRADAADRTRAAGNSWFIPSVYLSADYGMYEVQAVAASVENTGAYKSTYDFGIFLHWNLFDGGVALAQEKEAVFRKVQAEKSTRIAKLQMPVDFEYWKRRYLSNTDHYNAKKFDISRSEESVRLAREEQRAGTRTTTETLDAELDLFRAKAGTVNALINALEAQIQLELSLGREI